MKDEGATLPPDTMSASTDGTSPSLAFLRDLARVSTPGQAPLAEPEPFAPARFELRRRLGAGGFGVVYEAFDRERHATVALKTLRRRDGSTLYRFKREFRTLVELSHENLVQLYELHAEGEAWFFTMELVPGGSALDHVRTPAGSMLPFDEERLRAVLAGLSRGLAFLHRSGKLHRDVKPSNVMVTAEGRVVILDFGLVADIAQGGAGEGVVGTPAYMAPEQAAGLPVGVAADWYAVGVMLHQALTGRLPDGAGPLVPPSARVAGVPEDLDQLCVDLLSRAPEKRPGAREVRERLASRSARARAHSVEPARREAPFIGRLAELAALRGALTSAAAESRAVVTLVHGRSGAGKSALGQRFVDEVRRGGRLALTARCFEQESVPYKAVDGIVDELGQTLLKRPRSEIAALLPPDIGMLARLFPVLRQLGGQAAAARAEAEGNTLRRRAFAALVELIGRLDPCPVLVVDDLQWGDLDSIALLLELAEARSPLLLVASYRTEEAEVSPVLRAFREGLADRAQVREIEVGDLDEVDAEALSRALLEAEGRAGDALAEAVVQAIVAEGRGNPFLISEIARHHPGAARPSDTLDSRSGGPGPVDPGAHLASRIDRLPDQARRLLEVVALAGQPIARAVASRAAFGDEPDAPEMRALAELRTARLLRVQRAGEREELFPYHDRIRETVADRLAEDARRGWHDRLATALAMAGAEPERIFVHLRGAGRPAEAARHAAEAAEAALAALAFDRAARLYREALALDPSIPAAQARTLRTRLGDALTGAGRPREAALAYLAAAEGTDAEEALPSRLRAFELLLAAGYVEEGFAVLRRLAHALGIDPPSSRARSLLTLAETRLRLAARRLHARAAPPDARALARVDVYAAGAMGLVVVDPLLAAEFQARHLLAALEIGEPRRLARALSLEGASAAIRHGGPHPSIDRALAGARTASEQAAHPRAAGIVLLGEGIAAMIAGRWREAADRFTACESILRERGAEAWWELDQARLHRANCLWMVGEVKELSTLVPALLAEARERGNRLMEAALHVVSTPLVELALGRPDRAREAARSARERWPIRPGSILDVRALANEVRVALYEGDGPRARALITGDWPALLRAELLSPATGAEVLTLHALAAASAGDLWRAAADAHALARSGVPFAAGSAMAVEAVIARRRGETAVALALLDRLEERAQSNGAALIVAAARRRRGAWMGGDLGRAMAAEAEAWMIARGVRSPDRITALLLGDVT